MHHFMCVTDASLDFTDNKIIIFTGQNANGKSTVQSAISLCLIEDKRSDSYKEFIQTGHKDALIELDAEIKGAPIHFDINLHDHGRSQFERKVTFMGKEYNNSEVSDLLDTFDLKYYSDIIMSTQGSSDDIIKLSPTQRERFLQKLLNFEFDAEIEECKGKIDEFSEKIKTNQQLISFNEDNIKTRKGEIKEIVKLNFSEENVQKVSQEVADLTQKLENYSNLIQTKTKEMNERLRITKEIGNHKNTLSSYESQKNTILSNIKRKEETQKIITESTNKLIQLNKDYAAQNKIAKEAADTYEQYLTTVDGIRYDVAQEKAKVDELLKQYKLIQQGKCPTCKHEFDIQEKTTIEKEVQEESKIAEKFTDDLTLAEQNLANLLSDKETSSKKLNDIKSEITSETRLKESYEKNVDNRDYDSELTKIGNLMGQHNSNIEVLEKQLQDVEKQIEETDAQLSDYSEISQMLSEKQKLLNTMNKAINENNAILSANESAYRAIEASNAKIQECRDISEKYRIQQKTYDEALGVLSKTFPNYLIVKTCAKLEKEMNNFIQVVFPKMEVRLFQNKKGVEFFYTTDRSKIKDWKKENLLNVKMASGFEKSCLSTAFKIALSKAYSLPFAFLDEIDCYGDESSAEHLFESLVSNDIFDQLFIISHKSNVRDMIESRGKNIKTYYVKNGKFSLEED